MCTTPRSHPRRERLCDHRQVTLHNPASQPIELTPSALDFCIERHIAILSTLSRDPGTIHSVPVGFTVEAGVLRIITSDATQKVRNIERAGRATVAQVDGARWISFAGPARVVREADAVAHAVALYASRYRQPRVNPTRVVIDLQIVSVMGSTGMGAVIERE